MDKERLHAAVEALNFNDWKCRALLHAMIDYGRLAVLECQLPDCGMDSREFVARVGETAGRGQPGGKGLVFDHIQPRLQGGSDRPENLRVVHAACNTARTVGRKDPPEVRARKSRAARARENPGWQQALKTRRPGWNRTKTTPEIIAAIQDRYARGERLRDLAEEYGMSYSTAHKIKSGVYD